MFENYEQSVWFFSYYYNMIGTLKLYIKLILSIIMNVFKIYLVYIIY